MKTGSVKTSEFGRNIDFSVDGKAKPREAKKAISYVTDTTKG